MFIEPTEVVEANNRVRQLEAEERREIIRILTVFSDEVRPHVPEILNSYHFLATMDLIYAKAQPTKIPDDFWETLSISATYYLTPALAGILTTAAVVLMCYKGYDWRDELVTTISGIFGLMIVIFPCDCSAASSNIVGFFQLPIAISNVIHLASAVIFFILLAINSLFLFTLGESDTKQKRIRNIIYKVCGIGMFCTLFLLVLPIQFSAKIFIVEAIALTFFGISWLVKGQIFGLFADK